MTRIADIRLLLQAVDLGSLTAAARALDCSPAAASAAIKRLEAEWRVPLLLRSTRSLRPSPQSERLLPQLRQALAALDLARSAASAQVHSLSGELKLALPSDLGRNLLLPWLEDFMQQHPALQLRLHLGDHNTDLLRNPVDMAVRYGTPKLGSQVALPLASDNRRVLVAAPSYLARHGMPNTADELAQHECLRYMLGGELPSHWPLQVNGQWASAAVQGRRASNDGEVVKRWAVAGLGLAYKSRLDVVHELASGQLVHVNPHWVGEPAPLALIVSGRQQLTHSARALRDHVAERLAGLG